MFAFVVNALLIVAGSALGMIFQSRIHRRFSDGILSALALVTMMMGIQMAVEGLDSLCGIICLAVGTALGVALKIEERLESLGSWIKARLLHGREDSAFTQGFVSASLLFCVGSMAVMGAMEAGIHDDYSILVSKGVIDGVASIAYAAAMGVGVAFSALPILVYEGLLTFLFALVGPMIPDATLTQMSAVGGCIIVGIGFNMLNPERHIPVGYMLPAIFLPLIYLPLAGLLG